MTMTTIDVLANPGDFMPMDAPRLDVDESTRKRSFWKQTFDAADHLERRIVVRVHFSSQRTNQES